MSEIHISPSQNGKAPALPMTCLLAALLAACGQAPTAGAPQAPAQLADAPQVVSDLDATQGALRPAAVTDPYTYYNFTGTDGVQTLMSTGEGVCWLAKVGGNLNSNSDYLQVYHSQGQWKLNYHSDSSDPVSGRVYCVKWTAFKTPTVTQPARWISNGFTSIANSCTSFNKDTWWGDAATYISYVGGDVQGIGGVYVSQSTSGSKSSTMTAVACATTSKVYGGAHSLFIGKPSSNDLPQFWGPGGVGVPYSTAYKTGSYRAVSWGPSTVEMAPTDRAFCYLSTLWGDFDAMIDEAKVYRSTNSAGQQVWKLSVYDSNPGGNKGIGAYANCYMLTQY
ncbi:hypothetical protein [Deinococcus apachensis]|uniref:hypothetical protein n=1 Tax=Deinococcus apachensis TaxID=309886 RepID=UPI00037BEFBA|nr:hypothetical protein [Deinococcus apachensis]